MADKELFCKDWNIDLTIFIASQKIKNFLALCSIWEQGNLLTKFLYICFDQILDPLGISTSATSLWRAGPLRIPDDACSKRAGP